MDIVNWNPFRKCPKCESLSPNIKCTYVPAGTSTQFGSGLPELMSCKCTNCGFAWPERPADYAFKNQDDKPGY